MYKTMFSTIAMFDIAYPFLPHPSEKEVGRTKLLFRSNLYKGKCYFISDFVGVSVRVGKGFG